MNKRIKGLDGYRGIFCILIVLYHFWSNRAGVFVHGYLAVDFFFVVSGFFLGCAMKEEKYSGAGAYFRHLFDRYFPLTTGILVFLILWNMIVNHWEYAAVLEKIPHLLYEIFYMHLLGISSEAFVCSYLWYIPVLIFIEVLFYAIYCVNKKFFLSILLPVLILGTYSHIFARWGSLADFRAIDQDGYFIKGIYRGGGGVSALDACYILISID